MSANLFGLPSLISVSTSTDLIRELFENMASTDYSVEVLGMYEILTDLLRQLPEGTSWDLRLFNKFSNLAPLVVKMALLLSNKSTACKVFPYWCKTPAKSIIALLVRSPRLIAI